MEVCLSAPPPSVNERSQCCKRVYPGAADVDVDETSAVLERAAGRAPACADDATFCTALNALAAQADPQLQWPTSIAGLERLGCAAGLLEVLSDLFDDGWSEVALGPG